VGMEAEAHPGLGLALEVLRPAEGLHGLRERGLHREVDVPSLVADLVDATHAALAEQRRHLIKPHHDVADLPIDGLRRCRHPGQRQGVGSEQAAFVVRTRGRLSVAEGRPASRAAEGVADPARRHGGGDLAPGAGHAHAVGHAGL
jgi:hypothetical protein